MGNFGRPYYKCRTSDCEILFCFDDYRGIVYNNPLCHCGIPSRRTIAAKAPNDSSYLRLGCSRGVCTYETRELAQNDQPKIIARADMPWWVGSGQL